ncbi:hypothetical protein DDB_G0276179 [Dictyostelium discoideum AX4]|uniref:Uncharacterized protein n=1 Tax=Dictyostelium discoideum TaxID=44689 RepID=Q552B4_DICDI|nr:hypothetical protein DDB_G0276179 [Dictyostelium discoideum AX4]EAL69389.1 hypothetical protein DDB_G0276179 [Dictyostelium discoideum AX4]|eukprot:XP_643314.1 hypothetical protein DDB_G0276179 [Dictyostelium discoideum AX4]
MIKIIFTFILLSVLLYLSESKFANFLPHSNNDCSDGNPYGIGYSIQLNICISAISSNLFLKLGNSNNSSSSSSSSSNDDNDNLLIVEQYEGGECSQENPTTTSYFKLDSNKNTCITTPYFQELNSTTSPPILYSKVVISDIPIFPKNSIVFGQFEQQCISNNLLYSYSFSNGLKLIEDSANNITDTYICSKNRPALQYCIAGKCIIKKIEEKCIGTTDLKISAFCQN